MAAMGPTSDSFSSPKHSNIHCFSAELSRATSHITPIDSDYNFSSVTFYSSFISLQLSLHIPRYPTMADSVAIQDEIAQLEQSRNWQKCRDS
jgi:hypothetical protein